MHDNYKRILVGDNTYQCGCRWERRDDESVHGDVLVECVFHKQATIASVNEFERKRATKEAA